MNRHGNGLSYVPKRRSVRNVLRRLNPARQTRVLVSWLLGFGLIGGGLFAWVATRSSIGSAYDVITQARSPIGSELGIPGVLLGIFGYFVAPAIIGAVVAAVYASISEMTDARISSLAVDIAGQAGRVK
jgi:hypothetical protein